MRAHVNGCGTQLFVELSNFTTYCHNNYSLALDAVRGHVYFRTVRRIYNQTVEYLCDIFRSRLDGTDVEHIVSQECTVSQQLTHCQAALAIDVANGRLFYVREVFPGHLDTPSRRRRRGTLGVWRLVIWQVWVDPYPGTPSVFHGEEAKQRTWMAQSYGYGPYGTQMVVSGDHLYWSGTRRDTFHYQIKRAHLGRGDVNVFCCGKADWNAGYWLGAFAVDEPGGYIYWLAALPEYESSGLARIQRTPILCEFPPGQNHECRPYVSQTTFGFFLLILVAASCLAICLLGNCRRSDYWTDLVSVVAVLAVGVTLTLVWLPDDWRRPIDYFIWLLIFAVVFGCPACPLFFIFSHDIHVLLRSGEPWTDLVVVAAVLVTCYTQITATGTVLRWLALACGWLVGLLCLVDVLWMIVVEIGEFRRRVPSADRCILLVMCGVWDIVSDVSLCMLIQRVDPRFYVVVASICLPVLVACFLACRLRNPRYIPYLICTSLAAAPEKWSRDADLLEWARRVNHASVLFLEDLPQLGVEISLIANGILALEDTSSSVLTIVALTFTLLGSVKNLLELLRRRRQETQGAHIASTMIGVSAGVAAAVQS